MKYWTINIEASRKLTIESEELISLQNDEYDAIIIFGQTEAEFQKMKLYQPIVDIAEKKNIKVYVILGSNNYHTPPEGLPKNLEIIFWPTYWIRYSVKSLILNNKINDNLEDLQYKYHFVYMNHIAKHHRCLLIDNIAKDDLLRYSAYSWHNKYYNNKSKYVNSFKFKFYDGSIKTMDTQFTGTFNYWLLPDEYHESFFQVVSETNPDVQFITEKTISPLLLGKPFIVFGAVKTHKLLKDLGFELYDELFDYSFDNYEDIDNRVIGICENIKRITELSLDECRQYHNKIQYKIIHNRNRAIELAYDTDMLPQLVKEVIKHYELTGKKLDEQLINCEVEFRDTNSKICIE